MTKYDEKDLSKEFARVFDLSTGVQALVSKDADGDGLPTVAITFHSDVFGTMSYHRRLKEGKTLDELLEEVATEKEVTDTMAIVLSEMNLIAEHQAGVEAEEDQPEIPGLGLEVVNAEVIDA